MKKSPNPIDVYQTWGLPPKEVVAEVRRMKKDNDLIRANLRMSDEYGKHIKNSFSYKTKIFGLKFEIVKANIILAILDLFDTRKTYTKIIDSNKKLLIEYEKNPFMAIFTKQHIKKYSIGFKGDLKIKQFSEL